MDSHIQLQAEKTCVISTISQEAWATLQGPRIVRHFFISFSLFVVTDVFVGRFNANALRIDRGRLYTGLESGLADPAARFCWKQR